MLRKISNFIFDFLEYIIFFFLIILAFAILLSGTSPEVRMIQGNIANSVKFIHKPKSWINQLSGLVKENKILKEKNVKLTLLNIELKEAYLENIRLHKMLGFQDSTQLKLIPARVLNEGTTPVFNSFLIDAGESKDVRPQMAVISTDGVVGKTISVAKSVAVIQILNDANFRLSIRFQDSRVIGILHSIHGGLAEVSSIPKTAVINPGEEVITSGYSDIFPPDIGVGTVLEISQEQNGLYLIALIKPYVDLRSLEEVFIVDLE